MRSSLLALAAAVTLSAAPLLAQPLPLGPEIVVVPERVLAQGLATNQDGSFGIDFGTRARFFTPADTLAGSTNGITWLSTRGNGYVDVRMRNQGGRNQIVARLLDATGQPVSPEILLVNGGVISALKGDPAGGFFVAWATGVLSNIEVRRFDAQGNPAGPIVRLEAEQIWDLAPLPGGGFAVAEIAPDFSDVFVRAYRPDGAPAGPKIGLDEWIHATESGLRIGADGGGRIIVVWPIISGGIVEIRARRIDASGQFLGPTFLVTALPPGADLDASWTYDVAVRTDGSFLVSWDQEGACFHPCNPYRDNQDDIWARGYDAADAPFGPAFLLSDSAEHHQEDGAVEAYPGGWVASWITLGPEPAIKARRIFAPGCGGTAPALCLQNGRFRAEVTWRVPATGTTGAGTPIPLTGDTGSFWFFSPANYELVVKVLDGRGINGHFWVFFGSLTDVEFDLTVTDTLTGQRRTYHNPAGTMASRADTEAF